jgi:hypothetical protein
MENLTEPLRVMVVDMAIIAPEELAISSPNRYVE